MYVICCSLWVFCGAKTSIKTSMRWSVFFFYLSSKRNRKFKYLVQAKSMGENIITNIMKVSVAGTSLKKVRKCLGIVVQEKKNSVQAEESNDCKFRPQRYKFPQRLRWSRRRRATMTLSCNRPNGIMKPPALRKSKYNINTCSFRLHNNCGSTHPSMTASKGNKLPPSFSGFKSQKFLRESSYDGVSGTGNDEHSTVFKQLSKCLLSLVARSVPPFPTIL